MELCPNNFLSQSSFKNNVMEFFHVFLCYYFIRDTNTVCHFEKYICTYFYGITYIYAKRIYLGIPRKRNTV